ncbi:hypothetical protein STHAL_14460 [Streptomyces halstedii]|uniref:PH domain-containing protein n=1 Tax=Streptomyces halstedii TaxID=1944 RepID=A0ABS6TQX3_STRHA|nr:hypothetical protein [Streptomyces halstedii]MBV7670665.1 hypothetical protein [Streptomyces halstedii]
MIELGKSVIRLRRKSWRYASWIMFSSLGAGMVLAVIKVSSKHGFGEGWKGIPVLLVFYGFVGRIVSSEVRLSHDSLTVVNPLRTYTLPRSSRLRALKDSSGSLQVTSEESGTIDAFAFGGSIIDGFVGTVAKVEREIASWVNAEVPTKSLSVKYEKKWTRCRWSDLSLLLALLVTAVGLTAGALAG